MMSLAGEVSHLQGPAQTLEGKILQIMDFLGYPYLMATDILVPKAKYVPVGEDRSPS